MTPSILDVRGLSVAFKTRDGLVRALENVSFSLTRGETLGMVGESGSGKSVSAYAIMGLLGDTAEVTAQAIDVGGTDVLRAPRRTVEKLRGRRMAMIFQNARNALNPIRPVGQQIADVLCRHRGLDMPAARRGAAEALAEVRIPDPERRAAAYPFELSGGMCQRIMIALAFASEPELLIADEPTTGLDVTTQAAIMDLIRDQSAKRRMSTILITHDLALAAEHCDRFAVMHAGHVVEQGTTAQIYQRPVHPYTGLLMRATPTRAGRLDELTAIPGNLPDLRGDLPHCRFLHRCDRQVASCRAPLPRREVDPGHLVSCHMPWRAA